MATALDNEQQAYDAIIVVSFGGPEGPQDVAPFLENATRGRGISKERLAEVGAHYDMFGGVSPINASNRALIAALETELARHGLRLPVYFGNRNWHPMLEDAVAEMAADGIGRALAFVTSAYSSYSGCRQYLEDIERACEKVGAAAPRIDKLRAFWNHPGFIEPMVANVEAALEDVSDDEHGKVRVVFSAHSLPQATAEGCDYQAQLVDASRLVAERASIDAWDLVYQSRSGPPAQPWLEPDILDHLEALRADAVGCVMVVPIGFICDHMEIVYDLDVQVRKRAAQLGLELVRVETVGTAPRFVAMIRELIEERTTPGRERLALGSLGSRADQCPSDCCPPPRRPSPRS